MNHYVEELGLNQCIDIRLLDVENDIETIHSWFQMEYASFWNMQNMSVEETRRIYDEIQNENRMEVYLGFYKNRPAFLMECYSPDHDEVGEHYPVKPGDIGMHFMVGPAEEPVPGFTRDVLRHIMAFLFCRKNAKRVVVEPDVRNEKVHKLNAFVGFRYDGTIQLRKKRASLGFCSKFNFMRTLQKELPVNQFNYQQPDSAVAHLSPEAWTRANRHLVCKALSEFCHEQIFTPTFIESADNGWAVYQVQADESKCSYFFKAKKMHLRHWRIQKESISRVIDGKSTDIDALVLINDFKKTLGISEEKLPIYLDEISSTLYGAAYKIRNSNIPCSELVDADYQTFESSMTEGHPGFVANNGRIGFDAFDYHAYAPETGGLFNIIWIAVHRDHAEFTCTKDVEYFSFIKREIGEELFKTYVEKLSAMRLDSDNYYFMPAHPWQWYTKLSIAFASYIANRKIVPLGISKDSYAAQQSIRTYFNKSNTEKSYVKTSLSILNMGFMRGLSPYYMKGTPAINTVLQGIISSDKTLNRLGFSILREIASIGFRNYYYESALTKDSPYKKMFSALWRESPIPLLKENERLMTMTALLHVDYDGKALIAELIKRSALSPEVWLNKYLDTFLQPLLHCFYAHDLVFMPHCENLIVVLDGYVPKRVFMKDLAEECVILNKDAKVPEDAARMVVDVPEDYKLLGIFIDVFDGVFRFMSHILEESGTMEEERYWRLVAECAQRYQADHPELTHRFQRYDFFAPTFMHSCLNRLQLKNNLQMINLSDPASSLIMAEPLNNPISQFADKKPATYREKEAAC